MKKIFYCMIILNTINCYSMASAPTLNPENVRKQLEVTYQKLFGISNVVAKGTDINEWVKIIDKITQDIKKADRTVQTVQTIQKTGSFFNRKKVITEKEVEEFGRVSSSFLPRFINIHNELINIIKIARGVSDLKKRNEIVMRVLKKVYQDLNTFEHGMRDYVGKTPEGLSLYTLIEYTKKLIRKTVEDIGEVLL